MAVAPPRSIAFGVVSVLLHVGCAGTQPAPTPPALPSEPDRAGSHDGLVHLDGGGDGDQHDGAALAPANPPAPPTVIDARPVPAAVPDPPRGKRAAVRLRKVRVQKADPVRTEVDPAPRPILHRGMIPAWVQQFETSAPVSTLSPGARNARWREFLQQVVPEHLRPIVQRFFMDADFARLAANEEQHGALDRIERFDTNDGQRFLAVFVQTEPTAPVSIYDQHHHYTAVAFADAAEDGRTVAKPVWALDLDALFPGLLQLEDIQLVGDGTLLVNAVYPSYAKEVGKHTAYLYAVDPVAASVRWRTDALVSRSEFLVHGDIVVAGYGFTAEPDFLHAIDLSTGAVLSRLRIPTLHDRLRLVDGMLHVTTYDANLVVAVERD